MKVVLEAQHAVGHPQLRGVGMYSLNLIEALLKRKKYDYELSYFDFKGEAGNRARAEKYFSEYGVPFRECNELDYRVASRDDSVFQNSSYNDYTRTCGDVYHFMCPVTIPTNLKGKMVLTVHDIMWESFPGSISPHTEELCKIATERINRVKPYVIADSESTKAEILKYTDIPENNIEKIYISYDEYNMYPEKTEDDKRSDNYFLFLGAFERNKNIVRIIKAFNIVADKYKDIKLIIAGKKVWDSTDDMMNEIESSPHRDNISVVGYVDTETKRRLYSNALCFLFPSLCEGFGIPVLEAMACGCPVITADNTSLPEVGGDAAIYVDAENTEQLAHEMERVLTGSVLREDMIRRGFARKDMFSWDRTAEEVENFYAKVSEMQ